MQSSSAECRSVLRSSAGMSGMPQFLSSPPLTHTRTCWVLVTRAHLHPGWVNNNSRTRREENYTNKNILVCLFFFSIHMRFPALSAATCFRVATWYSRHTLAWILQDWGLTLITWWQRVRESLQLHIDLAARFMVNKHVFKVWNEGMKYHNYDKQNIWIFIIM